MFGMNPEQTVGQARTFLAFFGGIAAALGWTWFGGVSEAFLNALGPVLTAAGPVMGIAAAIWSAINKTKANLVTTVAALPEVKKIELQPTQAAVNLERATPPNVLVAR